MQERRKKKNAGLKKQSRVCSLRLYQHGHLLCLCLYLCLYLCPACSCICIGFKPNSWFFLGITNSQV